MYRQSREYFAEIMKEEAESSQEKIKECEPSYEFFKNKASLSLLKSLLVIDNCREIVQEKFSEKTSTQKATSP
jgi:hypothetical protein